MSSRPDPRRHDGVRVLTLNEPPANTYSYEMMRELDAAILDARMDEAVHVIVLTGAGDKFFCAGATIGMLKDADAGLQVLLLPARQRDAEPAGADAEARDRRAQRPHRRRRARGRAGRRPPDRAARTPARSACPKSRSACCPAPAARSGWRGCVGKARAMELMVSGRLMTMDEAAAIGLVTEVWDAERLAGRTFLDAVVDYARQFTPPHKASRAVGRIKRAVQSGLEAGSARASPSSASCSSCCSRATTRKKASRRTWRSGSRSSRAIETTRSTCKWRSEGREARLVDRKR